ncbi:hypothetical protein ACQ3I4_07095 [Zafaria sp. Z1313]|uniref:hypothetical protein n=1 Tax=unclassified Zafaria TaxID=2828765 RepID=UPI002E7A946F|nr:hypothetical protein [Zafaria sp. J156]MEE1620410.1 hypothetical protein [Zafaria sp. J156]
MPAPSRSLLPAATAVIAALVAGGLSSVVGTMLHAQLSYAGDVPVPWGAVLALVFTGSMLVLAAAYSERLWAAALGGVTAYVLTAWTALDTRNRLIVSWANAEQLPGPALAGALWMYGIVAATVVALFIAARVLRRR